MSSATDYKPSAGDIKRLRDDTGAGMLDCRKALLDATGDYESARKNLIDQGLSKAAKKADRATKEGLVGAYIAPLAKVGVLVEINCETDFVARNERFAELVENVARHIATAPVTAHLSREQISAEELASIKAGLADSSEAGLEKWFAQNVLLDQPYGDGKLSVAEVVGEAVGKLGENIQVRRYARFEAASKGRVGDYIHPGGKIGVLVEVERESDSAEADKPFGTFVRDVAMHVAAMPVKYVSRDQVAEEELTPLRAEFALAAEGKPANIVDRIVEGKLNKWFEENVLLEQPFIKDDDKTVAELVAAAAAEVGEKIQIRRYAKFALGEQ